MVRKMVLWSSNIICDFNGPPFHKDWETLLQSMTAHLEELKLSPNPAFNYQHFGDAISIAISQAILFYLGYLGFGNRVGKSRKMIVFYHILSDQCFLGVACVISKKRPTSKSGPIQACPNLRCTRYYKSTFPYTFYFFRK